MATLTFTEQIPAEGGWYWWIESRRSSSAEASVLKVMMCPCDRVAVVLNPNEGEWVPIKAGKGLWAGPIPFPV